MIRQFTSDLPPSIRFSNTLAIALYRVAGETDETVKSYCEHRLGDHHGILFITYKNYPLAQPYPLLWSLELGHSTDERKYLDGERLSRSVIEKLALMLGEQMIDEVAIPVFKVFKSDILKSILPSPVNSQPAAYKAGSNEITLDNGVVLEISHPMKNVPAAEADGYFQVEYALDSRTLTVDVLFRVKDCGDQPKVDFAPLTSELLAKFTAYAKENYLPNATVSAVHTLDNGQLPIEGRAVLPDLTRRPEPVESETETPSPDDAA